MSESMGESPDNTVDQRIRVLWLIKGLGPGGAETLLVSAARVADHATFAYEAAYVVPQKSLLAVDLERAGVQVHSLGPGRGGTRSWPLRLRSLLQTGRYDIVHVHSPIVAGVARIVVATLPRHQRPLLVSTEHNTWDSFVAPTRWINGLTATMDAHRWAVSGRVAESMWPSRRRDVETLVHGLVLEDIKVGDDARQRIRRELALPADAVVAVTVANLRVEKDYPNLLRAARNAVDRVPRLVFLAVGQGKLEAEIQALHAKLGLGDSFRLLGYRADVMDVLGASDLFVLGSRHEGFPIAVMEALAVGLPIVATDVGGVSDAITDQEEGLLVPPHRPDLLADAIVQVARDDELRARMAASAHSQGPRFDVRTAVQSIERTYRQLVAGS